MKGFPWGFGYGTVGTVPAKQVQGPEFKPNMFQKKMLHKLSCTFQKLQKWYLSFFNKFLLGYLHYMVRGICSDNSN
jgi:hypothetical protein